MATHKGDILVLICFIHALYHISVRTHANGILWIVFGVLLFDFVSALQFQIPFSKFYLTAKGCVQDKHHVMESTRVARIGITAVGLDWMDGEFNLELDYIGVEFNPYHSEQSAYEMYKAPNFVMGS